MIQVSARIFPIGFLIEVDNADFNPNDFYLNGTWERYGNGRVIVGVDENDSDFNTTGKSGGSKYLQEHTHFPIKTGTPETISGDQAVSSRDTKGYVIDNPSISQLKPAGIGNSENLQPYITAYRWKLISYSD